MCVIKSGVCLCKFGVAFFPHCYLFYNTRQVTLKQKGDRCEVVATKMKICFHMYSGCAGINMMLNFHSQFLKSYKHGRSNFFDSTKVFLNWSDSSYIFVILSKDQSRAYIHSNLRNMSACRFKLRLPDKQDALFRSLYIVGGVKKLAGNNGMW